MTVSFIDASQLEDMCNNAHPELKYVYTLSVLATDLPDMTPLKRTQK